MIAGPFTVEEWMELNSHRLIDCRWGCRITPEACRSYQLRGSRYVIHFNGHAETYPRINADYLRCVSPEPCPYLMSDEDAAALQSEMPANDDLEAGDPSWGIQDGDWDLVTDVDDIFA